MDRLLALAHQEGLNVEFRPLQKHSGLLMPGRLILINNQKSFMTQRAALAHELGHIHYGHDWRFPHERHIDEFKADKFAADLLIDPHDYAVAELVHDGSITAIAAELEVPVKLLLEWQRRHWHSQQTNRCQTLSEALS